MKIVIRCAFSFLLVFACFAMISCRNPAAGDSGSATIVINLGGASEAARSSFGLPPGGFNDIGINPAAINHYIRLYNYVPTGPNVHMTTLPAAINHVLIVNPGIYVITVSGNISGWPFSFREYGPFTLSAGETHSVNIQMQRLDHSVLVLNPPSLNKGQTLFLNPAALPQTVGIRSFGNNSGLMTVMAPSGFEVSSDGGVTWNDDSTSITAVKDALAIVNFQIRPNASTLTLQGPHTGNITISGTGGFTTIPLSFDSPHTGCNFNIATGLPVSGPNWIFNDITGILTVNAGANVMITGNVSCGRRIEADSGSTITLNNVSITMPGGTDESPLLAAPGGGPFITLNLVGTNELIAGDNRAGIETTSGSALTITGSGILNAFGGTSAAGIGGGNGGNGTTVIINNGTVTAIGSDGGAGIGGGNNGNGGSITINGGTIRATAGSGNAAAIGRGDGGSNESVWVNPFVTWNYWTNTSAADPGGLPTGTGVFIYSNTYSFIKLQRL